MVSWIRNVSFIKIFNKIHIKIPIDDIDDFKIKRITKRNDNLNIILITKRPIYPYGVDEDLRKGRYRERIKKEV